SDVHQHVVADLRFRHEVEKGLAGDSAERNSADTIRADGLGVEDSAGYRQTHIRPALLLILRQLPWRAATMPQPVARGPHRCGCLPAQYRLRLHTPAAIPCSSHPP